MLYVISVKKKLALIDTVLSKVQENTITLDCVVKSAKSLDCQKKVCSKSFRFTFLHAQ